MTPLVAKAVFLASSALGVASLGSTAYLVAHPRAFAAPPRVISPEPITAPIAARPLPPAPTAVPDPEVMELQPVTITGSKAPLIPRHTPRPAKTMNAKEGMNPCSEWRDMGPSSVKSGQTAGQHRVRTLCP